MAAYNELADQPTTYDVVCIGFGTKGLALSTVLADHDPTQKVLVVERDAHFNGDLGFAATNSSAGSTFLRDLITLRNPRSEYTFINFLHETNLLVAFTNASQLITQRENVSRLVRDNLVRRAARFNIMLDDVSLTVRLPLHLTTHPIMAPY